MHQATPSAAGHPIGRLAVAAVLVLALAPAVRADAPNVVLVSIDSLRADRTSVYGNARRTTPTLERLAAAGVTFDRAYSPTSWTLPAHASLLTGLDQMQHGVLTPTDRISDATDVLAAVFARHGYETAGFYSGPFLDPTFGFGRGFDRYEGCPAVARDATSQATWEASHEDQTGVCMAHAVARWARRRAPGRFFAFIHLWDVHYDYLPPAPYAALWDTGYAGPLDGRNIAGDGFPLDASPRDVAHLLALYDGEIRWTDAVLARILRVFERRDMVRDTVVVVTADHGDEFLDHGGKGHQHALYEELVHVPLVVWAPGRLPAGRRIATPVSLIDVAPTLLAIAGLPPLEQASGQSLLPLVADATSWHPPVRGALYHPSMARLLEVTVHVGERAFVGTVRGGTVQPRARKPSDPPGGPALARLARRWAAIAGAVPVRTAKGPPVRPELPAAVADRLRALGYIDE